jgi:superfamily I DNA/RNA helicase/RecB family exonuclease
MSVPRVDIEVMTAGPAYRLLRAAPAPAAAPELDAAQQRVVDHNRGPLLVLAGPGTGKTTTLVESVVARINSGMRPDEVLVLTFGRRAAEELRERIVLRLGRTLVEPAAFTFHGFCLSLLRAHCVAGGLPLPRLLSGAERQVRINELLVGNAVGEGLTVWPADLRPALRLRGFAQEVADALDRARERGIDGAGLRLLGECEQRPEWSAAGQFLDEYLDVLEARGEIDYAGLVTTALALLDGPLGQVCGRFTAVYVDEYQDTDPAQERLLHRLAGGGRLLVAVGDPDQSIYGFRGADVTNILDFPERFAAPGGAGHDGTVAVASLATCRRMTQPILDASRVFARRIPRGRLAALASDHRALACAEPGDKPGAERGTEPDVSEAPAIRLFGTGAEQALAIADLLRRAHLLDGLGWDDMAVLVRSGVRSIAVLRRALMAAGVPVAVATDEIALGRDPALAPMLAALRVAAHGWAGLDAESVRLLLLSPLAGGTATQLRALGRRLRDGERTAGVDAPRPSGELIRDAVTVPAPLGAIEDWIAEPARRLHDLLTAARAAAVAGATPQEVLWGLWDGSPWPGRLHAMAGQGGAAARAADRDMDALVALFEAATRLEDRRPHAGVSALLEEISAQEIPAGPLAERATAAGAVRLLTAHRAKGLEWELVVIADVQDGAWPDGRRRSSLLDADRLGGDERGGPGVRMPITAAQLLAEERRLFYVALTRARSRLVITAVSGVDDDAERPSRFLEELGLEVPAVAEPPGVELLSAPSVVARLRRTLGDEQSPADLRDEAAEALAELATAVDTDGAALVAAADPARWWGLAELTAGPRPVRPPDQPLKLSGTAVASYDTCPRRWFLDREVRAAGASSIAQGLGSVVHALAEAVALGQLPADPDALTAELDTVWSSLPFDSPWGRVREHGEARKLLERFLTWHAVNPRQLIGVEVDFEVQVGDDVVLRGRADRLELDADGCVVVVDLKTSKNPPQDNEVPTDPQLGMYQLATRAGAFTQLTSADSGGAELVQLRREVRTQVKVQQQPPLPDDADTWADRLAEGMSRAMRAERFVARPNKHCKGCAYRTSCPAVEAGSEVIA